MIPGYVGDDRDSAPLMPMGVAKNPSVKKSGIPRLFGMKDKGMTSGANTSSSTPVPPHMQIQMQPQPQLHQRHPSTTMQTMPQVQPASTAYQTAEQNEMDLYYGPLVQELGIDMHLVARKFLATFPFVPVPDDVAQSGDMVVGICVLMLFTLENVLTKSADIHLGFLFGTFIYGSLLLTFLLSMLRQTDAHIDLYVVMSALSYGLIPLLVPMFVCSFAGKSALESAQAAVVMGYLAAAILSSVISTKLLNAAVRLENVRALIAIPAFLITMCYVLVQISK